MRDHDLYTLASQHLDQRYKRRLWWYVNLMGFLAYIGLFITLAKTPLVFVAIFVLLAWIGIFALHSFAVEQAEAYDKNIEDEISRLSSTSRLAPQPAQLETISGTAPIPELDPISQPILSENALYSCDTLTPREREVLALLAAGDSNIDIAAHLVIAPNTVKRHVKHILSKLHVTNRIQAVKRARELALL